MFPVFSTGFDLPPPPPQIPIGVEVRGVDGVRPWRIALESDVVLLDVVAEIINGRTITKAKTVEGQVPVIAGGRTPAYMHNTSNAEGGCFTVSKSGAYSGHVWWHEHPIWASDCMVVRSRNEEEYLTFYLFLCMKAKQEEIYARQQGTGQPHVYRKHIVNFPIPKCDIAEQWDKVGEARELYRQSFDIKEQHEAELKQSVHSMKAVYEGGSMKREPLEAEYRNASPRQVAEALLRYRRGKAPRLPNKQQGKTKS